MPVRIAYPMYTPRIDVDKKITLGLVTRGTVSDHGHCRYFITKDPTTNQNNSFSSNNFYSAGLYSPRFLIFHIHLNKLKINRYRVDTSLRPRLRLPTILGREISFKSGYVAQKHQVSLLGEIDSNLTALVISYSNF